MNAEELRSANRDLVFLALVGDLGPHELADRALSQAREEALNDSELYVSLEKIDPRLLEASKDLYSSATRSFRKVILPLAMPGVLAGSMLVFIPSVGDFINADYLGSTQTTMIGNVIQKQFLVVKDYPAAAALSLVLMLIILGGVLLYTRALGTEDLV